MRRYIRNTVRNAIGLEEDCFTYVLRHTQLLPRQVLGILNAIALRAVRDSRKPFDAPFSERDVVDGVSDVEDTNANAILAILLGRV